MNNQVLIRRSIIVINYSAQACKQTSSIKLNEFLHAYIADIGPITVSRIYEVTELFNFFATGTLVPVVFKCKTTNNPLIFGIKKLVTFR